MRKILTLSLIITITIALTFVVIFYVGMQGFLFAWVLNLMLMTCVFIFTETLKSEFTSPYYNDKKWERNGKFYESLGINLFRKLLVWIGWEKLNKKPSPIENRSNSLIQLQYRTKQSELGHIIIMVIVLGFTIFVAFKYGIGHSSWLIILNILLNLYPIFLQRYNRPRLNRAIQLSIYRESQFSIHD